MHPHDPERAAVRSGGADGDDASSSRPFTMAPDRPHRPRYGRYLVVIGFVAIAGLVGQSLYRRWRWTETGTGRIEVAVHPEDATISLDGGPPRRSPATLILRAGPHTIAVERDGYAKVEQRIDLNPGETVEVPVSLMRMPEPPPAPRPIPARPAGRSRHSARASMARANGVSYIDLESGTVH